MPFFVVGVAGFGNAHDRKKSFKINEMPQMARMAHQKWHGGDFDKQKKKKQVKRNVNEM